MKSNFCKGFYSCSRINLSSQNLKKLDRLINLFIGEAKIHYNIEDQRLEIDFKKNIITYEYATLIHFLIYKSKKSIDLKNNKYIK